MNIKDQLEVANIQKQAQKIQEERKGPAHQLTDQQRQRLFELTRGKKWSGNNVIQIMKSEHNIDIAPSTVSRYKAMKELEPRGERGRPGIIDEVLKQKLIRAFTGLRKSGMPICASTVASCATGILEHVKRGITVEGGGHMDLSVSWAQKFMHANNIKVRRVTTDRIIPCKDIVAGGIEFFDRLGLFSAMYPNLKASNVYNADEFFVLLTGENGDWTWEFASNTSVAIRQDKAGFTCSVTSCCDGSMLGIQFVYKGTERLFVDSVKANPMVLQCARKDSHFQNADTFNEWCEDFEEKACKKRGDQTDEPIVLVKNSATQHSFQCVEEWKAKNIFVQHVPKRMTHIYQPADQYIISTIKETSRRSYQGWYKKIFSRGVDYGIAEATSNSAPDQRQRKVSAITEAAQQCTPACVTHSWLLTGIPRALWGHAQQEIVLYDGYKEAFEISSDGDISSLDEAVEAARLRNNHNEFVHEHYEEVNEGGEATPDIDDQMKATDTTDDSAGHAAADDTAVAAACRAPKLGRPPLSDEEKAERAKKKKTEEARGHRPIASFFGSK